MKKVFATILVVAFVLGIGFGAFSIFDAGDDGEMLFAGTLSSVRPPNSGDGESDDGSDM